MMEDRRQELRLTWEQAAAKGSITTETLRQVRTGDRPIRPLTKRAIEEGLDWPPGTVNRILSGDHHVPSRVEPGLADFVTSLREVLGSRFSAETKLRMIEELIEETGCAPQSGEESWPEGAATSG